MRHKNKLIPIGFFSLIALNIPAFSGSEVSSDSSLIREEVYVESPTDSDNDGKKDRIYVSITRKNSLKPVPSLITSSPYSQGGNDVKFHNVDVDRLPQDKSEYENELAKNFFDVQDFFAKQLENYQEVLDFIESKRPQYATVKVDSVGSGRSTGCPTSGDMVETLASKAVIDWLNGSAKAWDKSGKEVKATWSNGNAGMMGVSYNGTLPTMVASTGVKGLKAIVPIAAISSWYDYYRANGLVVGPGGYTGEDADVLAKFVVRKGTQCNSAINKITKDQGREHGDYTQFWKDRDYLPKAGAIQAATFIVHGQSDWNVKQAHAVNLWEAMEKESKAPKRAFFHRGGHSYPSSHNLRKKVNAWLDRYVGGADNIDIEAQVVEVETKDGKLTTQDAWPSSKTKKQKFYFNPNNALGKENVAHKGNVSDSGRTKKMPDLAKGPTKADSGRLIFLTEAFGSEKLLSGTAKVTLKLAVANRKAANITVALVDYDARNKATMVTRGWADPQNYKDLYSKGEPLEEGKFYSLSFPLEPKQYKLKKGHKLGVLIASTDYGYTIRPKEGTKIDFDLGEESHIDIWLD